jgi:hypothetical protein
MLSKDPLRIIDKNEIVNSFVYLLQQVYSYPALEA